MRQFVTDEEERLTPPEEEDSGIVARCDGCGDEIYQGEAYGVGADGNVICHNCLSDEWDDLTDDEQFQRMGYRAERRV